MTRVGRTYKAWRFLRSALFLTALAWVIAVPTRADTPVTLYTSLAGNINITGTGGTLRTNPDGTNSCTVTNNGAMTLSGIPAGATVVKAYLYWAGSGGDPVGGVGADYNVTFNGTSVTADRTYTAWYLSGYNLYFFGGVKDVTSMVTGNGVYTFADLTVQNANVVGGGQYCSNAAVLSAFSLMIVYSDPAETLHVVNIWEGFQHYRGASITLTPTNFIVPTPAPATPLSSRILIMTWEGDSGNSGALGGFTENLTFCSPAPCAGPALSDAYNPVNNQFNSTVDIPPSGPFSGINTTWGIDIDMYDITGMLPAAAASAQSVYSSGGDLVILMNQTMAIPNTPVADLALAKSHDGDFTVGTNGVYTLDVTNNGPNDATGTITVTDTLPAGLAYVSAVGTGWTCGAVGQIVTCTRPGPLTSTSSTPSITLTVSVGGAAYPSVTNTATVSSATFDNVAANSTANDLTTVLAPDLSTSTKTVVDSNGGDANPGDVLQYTITVNETAGIDATSVTVTDDIPANVTGFTVVSTPAGSTDNSTGIGTGANGTGYLDITGITVPANGSVTIVFEVTVGAVLPGTMIDNTAIVTPVAGTGATSAAPTVIVSQSSIPATGNKPLYLYGTPGLQLSRTPTPGNPAAITLAEGGASQSWTQSPVVQSDITLSPAVNPNVPVNLYLASNNNQNRRVVVTLACSSGGTTLTQTRIIFLTPTVSLQVFNLPLGAPLTCTTGNSWILTVQNTTPVGGVRNVLVYPVSGGNRSQVFLPSQNVINVDSVTAYSTAYPGVTTPPYFTDGNTVYLRAVVSDPFGSFDINANPPATLPTIEIKDANDTVIVPSTAMTQVADSGTLTKTFEYGYTPVPASGPSGFWTATVTAPEGTEGTVSDSGIGTFRIQLFPSLTIVKSVQTLSDPLNGSTNPKAIPGAIMLYTIIVTNSGTGAVDNNTMVLTDPIPANSTMYVDTGSGDPVTFSCSAVPPCGLGPWDYGSAVSYSSQPGGGPPYTYTPAPVGGYDPLVTGVRINPAGILNGAAGPPYPQFTVQFRVRID